MPRTLALSRPLAMLVFLTRLVWTPATLFLLLALPMGFYFAIRVPLGQVPDEAVHAVRADALSRGQWIGRRDIVLYDGIERLIAGVDADPVMVWVQQPYEDVAVTGLDRAKLREAKGFGWTAPIFIFVGPVATYLPIFYLPSAATIAVGRLLDAAPYQTLMAARLLNLLCYLLIAVAALLLARRAQVLLLCALSLPMSLYLAGSLNQDGMIIASCALAAALLTRAWDKVATPAALTRERSYRLGALLLAIIIAVKPPYFPLVVLLLLPLTPFRAWRDEHRLLHRLAICLLALLPAAIWTAAMLHYVATSVPWPSYHPGPLWPGDRSQTFIGTDTAAQMHVLLSQPTLFATLPLDSIAASKDLLLKQMIGALGWLRLYMGPRAYLTWYIALIAACLAVLAGRRDGGRIATGWHDGILLLLAVVAAISAIWLSQYLTWTRVGNALIEGPQGRYLLPLLPAFALALSCFALRGLRPLQSLFLLPPAIALAADLNALPRLIFSAYYGS